MNKINIFWFRRDLRLEDNAGLNNSLKVGLPVQPIFIFDKNILDNLPKKDVRVNFIHSTINRIDERLNTFGTSLNCKYDTPLEAWKLLTKEYEIQTVYTNRDYEPYAKDRDHEIKSYLNEKGIGFKDFKDHVIFNHDEVVKDNKEPYQVFTPYSKKWYDKLNSKGFGSNSYYLKAYPTIKYSDHFFSKNRKKHPRSNRNGVPIN